MHVYPATKIPGWIKELVLSFCLVCTACQCNFTRNKPQEKDLVGTYALDKKSREFVRSKGHYSQTTSTIALFSDGTIVLKNVPDWWMDGFGYSHGGYDSASGKWQVWAYYRSWGLRLDFKSTQGFSSTFAKNQGGFTTEMMLTGQYPPYKIYLRVGDPDNDEGMEFEKFSPSPE